MEKISSTIRQLLVNAEEDFSTWDAFRYKVKVAGNDGKKSVSVESKTYRQLKDDSECFSAALKAIGQQKKHIAIIGATSYEWVVDRKSVV